MELKNRIVVKPAQKPSLVKPGDMYTSYDDGSLYLVIEANGEYNLLCLNNNCLIYKHSMDLVQLDNIIKVKNKENYKFINNSKVTVEGDI